MMMKSKKKKRKEKKAQKREKGEESSRRREGGRSFAGLPHLQKNLWRKKRFRCTEGRNRKERRKKAEANSERSEEICECNLRKRWEP